MQTLDVFVRDAVSQTPVSARVVVMTPGTPIFPPARMTSGDGGCNLYFNGPSLGSMPVTVNVDAAGYAPFTNGPVPFVMQEGYNRIDVELVPFV